MYEQPKTVNPISPATTTDRRFMVILPLNWLRLFSLLPGAVVDGVLVGRAGHRHAPFDRPSVGVLPALARVGLRRGVQQAPGLELVGLEQPAGLADEVVDEGRRVFFDELDRPRLRAEHLLERRAVEIVAGGLAARGVRLDQDAQAPLLRHAD